MQSRPGSALLRLFPLSALVLTLASASLWAQDDGAAPPPGSGPPVPVHGSVVNRATGAALARALVRIDGSEVLAALTGQDGGFTIDGVPAGPHTIAVERPGFETVPQAGDSPEMQPHAIVVSAGMPPLALSLSPLNAIRLHLALSNGLPASTIGLTMFRRETDDGRYDWIEADNRQTTPAGEVRFHGLSDGAYLLATKPEYGNIRARGAECGPAAPLSMPGFASTFLPNAETSAGAAVVTVSGGQTVDLNYQLEPTTFYLVRVAVTHAAVPGGQDLTFRLLGRGGESLAYALHEDKDHTLCGYLPDGAYTLIAELPIDAGNRPRAAATPASLFGSMEFSVDGAASPGLRLALAPSSPTPIHDHYEPGPPAPPESANGNEEAEDSGEPLGLTVTPAHSVRSKSEQAPEADSNGEGSYSLSALAPGAYWIHAEASQTGVCLGTVTAAGEDLSQVPWNATAGGSGPPIDAVLRTDCAQMKLLLPPAAAGENQGDNAALFVYAVPLFPTLEDVAEAQIQPLSDSTAVLDALTPGPYRIFLFRTPRSIAFREPGVLDALGAGQDITLEPGDRQTVTLTGPAQ
jgi:hypothetical protein